MKVLRDYSGIVAALFLLLVSCSTVPITGRTQLDIVPNSTMRRRRYHPAATEAAVGRFFTAWDALASGGWTGPAMGAALNMGFDMLTLYFLFMAAGHALSPGVLLVGYGLPQLLAKLTILPGGVGIVEGTMAALYHSLGVPEAVNVVVILAYRVLSFWLPTLFGFPMVPYLQHISNLREVS